MVVFALGISGDLLPEENKLIFDKLLKQTKRSWPCDRDNFVKGVFHIWIEIVRKTQLDNRALSNFLAE
jgi:hypothetical protein